MSEVIVHAIEHVVHVCDLRGRGEVHCGGEAGGKGEHTLQGGGVGSVQRKGLIEAASTHEHGGSRGQSGGVELDRLIEGDSGGEHGAHGGDLAGVEVHGLVELHCL